MPPFTDLRITLFQISVPSIVVIGPGPRFKGGIANYTVSLARALDTLLTEHPEWQVHIVSWTQQYPAIMPRDFIDRKSRTDLLAGTRIQVHYLLNYNNPLTWRRTVNAIKTLQPKCVVIQWAIALQGLPLGWVARRLRKETQAEIIFDLHLVRQKEASRLDALFTRYALPAAHGYIVHALSTAAELATRFPKLSFVHTQDGTRNTQVAARPVLTLYHPVYEMFRPDPHFNIKAEKLRLGLRKHVFLFFGFIRKYKGLHNCIRAFAALAATRDDVSLLIVGESFWNTLNANSWRTRLKQSLFGFAKKIFLNRGTANDESGYNPLTLIQQLGIADRCTVVNEFVPNEDVYRYFQVSDAILLFYETATPSGVESLSYNFSLPVLATRVGHFPETITDGFNGYLADAESIPSMTNALSRFLTHPIPRANVDTMKQQLSWANYALCILRPYIVR